MSFRSSLLFISYPEKQELPFSAEFCAHLESANQLLQHHDYHVVVYHLKQKPSLEHLQEFVKACGAKKIPPQLVLLSQEVRHLQKLTEITNYLTPFKILTQISGPLFEHGIQEALEEHALQLQNQDLVTTVQTQNLQLKNLSKDLEDRVQKRQQYLESARQRLLSTHRQLEALHRALIAVNKAQTIAEMERLIVEAIQMFLPLSWIRIFVNELSSYDDFLNHSQKFYSVFSFHWQSKARQDAKIVFARDIHQPFQKTEKQFLEQVSEAASLAVERLNRLSDLEDLKQQWESTFNAIMAPLSIMNSQYDLIAVNRAFAEASNAKPQDLVGKKCYQSLFGRNAPCEDCAMGKKFHLEINKDLPTQKFYQVQSQVLKTEAETQFVNLYRDVTVSEKIRQEVLESVKMAELGTISSSIAHELNNPLAGITTFLQLMLSDAKPADIFYEDLIEMQKGANRCKHIIEDLLTEVRLKVK